MSNDSTSILYLTDKRFVHVKIQHCSFLLNEEEQYYRVFLKNMWDSRNSKLSLHKQFN